MEALSNEYSQHAFIENRVKFKDSNQTLLDSVFVGVCAVVMANMIYIL